MITVFNRKELLITYDLKRQSDVRTILQNHKIEYIVKVKNLLSPSPTRAGSRAYNAALKIDLNKSYEHKIYVKKCDYEKAYALIK